MPKPTASGITILKTDVEYENPFMRVLKHTVSYPDGKIKPFFVLDRRSDFSVIIPIFPDHTTLLVGQFRVPIQQFSWEFPMGSVMSKTSLQMAKQELREETGYKAGQWQKLGSFHLSPGHNNQTAHVFVARDLLSGLSAPEELEYLTVKRVSLRDVKSMIEIGTIHDGPTIAAYHLLHARVKGEA